MNALSKPIHTHGMALLALEHHGQSCDAVWVWPQGAQSVGLHAVLQTMELEGVSTDASEPDVRRHCMLQRVGTPAQPIWLLGNVSREVLCSVNLRTLSAGQQVRLAHGDLIEIGLTRFEVRLQSDGGLADSRVPAESTPLLDGFELTDLAGEEDVFSQLHGMSLAPKRSDFHDLIAPEPQGAKHHVQTLPEANLPVAADVVPVVEFDPLEALHAQYLRKLRDPSASDSLDLWTDVQRDAAAFERDPMQSLMDEAGTRSGLDDLLGQPQSIAVVLDSLQVLGSTDLLAPDPFDSVMRMFAPEDLRQPELDSLESIVRKSLPDLTRREHHNMAVDSAMPSISDTFKPTP